eukprot:3934095-Rhodomonas_salina.1
MEWGGSTDVDAVFDQLLRTAADTQLTAHDVAKMTVVIFSDMEFDAARQGNVPWETAHEAICAKFRDAGFTAPPTLVYWNLRSSPSMPVDNGTTPGVVLMSGFSAGMMKSFLSGQRPAAGERTEEEEASVEREQGDAGAEREKLTGLEVMSKILSKESYLRLEVAREDRP